ncbi:hypothetical protein B0T13DRAFT_445556 [Neurospora crassa]|nr:hypothetical protein B0T13DRAFT_445556 [Neurospora crassa]
MCAVRDSNPGSFAVPKATYVYAAPRSHPSVPFSTPSPSSKQMPLPEVTRVICSVSTTSPAFPGSRIKDSARSLTEESYQHQSRSPATSAMALWSTSTTRAVVTTAQTSVQTAILPATTTTSRCQSRAKTGPIAASTPVVAYATLYTVPVTPPPVTVEASNPGRRHQPTSRVASGRLGSHHSINGRVTNGHINKDTSHRSTSDRLDVSGFHT